MLGDGWPGLAVLCGDDLVALSCHECRASLDVVTLDRAARTGESVQAIHSNGYRDEIRAIRWVGVLPRADFHALRLRKIVRLVAVPNTCRPADTANRIIA